MARPQPNELPLSPQQLSSRLATYVSPVVDAAVFSHILEKGDRSVGDHLCN